MMHTTPKQTLPKQVTIQTTHIQKHIHLHLEESHQTIEIGSLIFFTDLSTRVERNFRPSSNLNSNNTSQLQQIKPTNKKLNKFKTP